MGNNRHGLGIELASSNLITPCPSMIDSYFKDQLKYNKVEVEDHRKGYKNAFKVRYCKALNHPDNPILPELWGISCVSNIIIDLYSGSVIDHYFKINKGSAIRTFSECPNIEAVEYVFKWHLNLVHITREYLKGGWLKRSKVKKEIEDMQSKYIILNEKGITNILGLTKPENVEFFKNRKVD